MSGPRLCRAAPGETPCRKKNLLLTNMLFSFIAAAMAVMVPLYLLEKNVDITYIGILLSLGPLSFMIVRIFLAGVADEVGTKLIGILYSIASLLSILLYAVFPSAAGLAAGNLSEGVRNSGFWAISRTETFSVTDRNPGRTFAYFSGMRQLADGAGRLAVGFLLAYLAFQGSFALFFCLSLLLFALIIMNENKTGGHSFGRRSMRERIFKQRPPTFWYAAALQLFAWLAYNMLLSFLVPVYLISSLKMGYLETGGMIALLSLAIAASTLLTMRWNFKKSTLTLLAIPMVPALLVFPFVGTNVVPLLLIISVGIGCNAIIAEYVLVDQVFRSKDVSTDIGVLYVPNKICEFLFLSLGGLVISRFGYAPLFFILALSVALFVVLARKLLAQAS